MKYGTFFDYVLWAALGSLAGLLGYEVTLAIRRWRRWKGLWKGQS
jgi:hypothetical protein